MDFQFSHLLLSCGEVLARTKDIGRESDALCLVFVQISQLVWTQWIPYCISYRAGYSGPRNPLFREGCVVGCMWLRFPVGWDFCVSPRSQFQNKHPPDISISLSGKDLSNFRSSDERVMQIPMKNCSSADLSDGSIGERGRDNLQTNFDMALLHSTMLSNTKKPGSDDRRQKAE